MMWNVADNDHDHPHLHNCSNYNYNINQPVSNNKFKRMQFIHRVFVFVVGGGGDDDKLLESLPVSIF